MTICGRHVMASVRDVKITEAVLMILCLKCYKTGLTLLKLRHYGIHISGYGVRLTSEFSVFCITAGWIAKMLFMLSFAYIAVQRTKHSCVQSILAYGCSNNNYIRQMLATLSLEAVCVN